jgi:hypothetical protein
MVIQKGYSLKKTTGDPMKSFILVLTLLSLTACNKGISKAKNNTGITPTLKDSLTELSSEKSLIEITEIEFRTAKGYGCQINGDDMTQPLFIERKKVKDETHYQHYFAATVDANNTIEDQLDFNRTLDLSQDEEFLSELGFSKKQIKKMVAKAVAVKTSTIIYFDENELSGHIERTAEVKDKDDKTIQRATKVIGEISDCDDSEMEVEVQ